MSFDNNITHTQYAECILQRKPPLFDVRLFTSLSYAWVKIVLQTQATPSRLRMQMAKMLVDRYNNNFTFLAILNMYIYMRITFLLAVLL